MSRLRLRAAVILASVLFLGWLTAANFFPAETRRERLQPHSG